MTGRNMDKNRTVAMVATHSFSGPEGAVDGLGNGPIMKGETFQATEQRAYHLESAKKAKRVDGQTFQSVSPSENTDGNGNQPVPPVNPEETTITGIPLDGLSIDKIRGAIAEKQTTAQLAYDYEMSRPVDERRKTLLEELRLVLDKPEEDDDANDGDDTDDSLNDEE